MVNPVMIPLVVVVVNVIPPGVDVIVYPVIAEPPLLACAVKLTVVCALPATAITLVGGLGTVLGITEEDEFEGVLLPLALVAITVKV